MPPILSVRALRVAAPMLALAGLSACSDGTGFPPDCPQIGILKDGADLTRFRGTGTDLTDMVVDGRITGFKGACSLDDDTHLRTSLSVQMELTRGPASTARDAVVTYFVSVAKGNTILDKRDYAIPVQFQENTDRAALTTDSVDLVLPVDAKTSGGAYRVLVSFQLTQPEMAFNRRRGAR